MSVNARVRKRVLHFTEEKKQIYVAETNRGDVISTEKIAQFVAQETGARLAQVKMILNSLTNSMIAWIEEGHGVRLGNLGSFMPSIKSASSENPEEVGVKKLKLTFYPSKELRDRVKEVSITTDNPYVEGEEPTDPEEDTNTDTGGGNGGGGSEME